MERIYQYYDEQYKSPTGAVAAGTEVTFRIMLPRRMGSSWSNLCIYKEGDSIREYPLSFERLDRDAEWWSVTFKPDYPGLYFYCFSLQGENGDFTTIKLDNFGNITFDMSGAFFQLTVYSADFKTPDFLKGGLIYQIFPDRFCKSGEPHSDVPSDRELRDDWGESPRYLPDDKGIIRNNDYFGGDLKGIASKMKYLRNLGVTCIYLNPIFEAHSNHRYNTADYKKIDPLLGSEKDFQNLCKTARKHGISVILDGVFSHTGDDSLYFNRPGRYGDKIGAFRDNKSPYYNWFQFENYPDKYASWWGIDTLPEVVEENEEYLNFICGEGGIIERWIELGAAGWRLDVADELPDSFIDRLRSRVKETDKEAIVIGEVWEDATTKVSHGGRRRFLLGRQLDSVMNYPFKEAILLFLRQYNSEVLHNTICSIIDHYPKQTVDVLMNFISTHDVERAITRLAGEELFYSPREEQAAHSLTAEQYECGRRMLKLAFTILYFIPGVPCVYYGDEVGMQGYRDPFNRGCFNWDSPDTEIHDYVAWLGKIRKTTPCLAQGSYRTISYKAGVFCFMRYDSSGALLVLVNARDRDAGVLVDSCFDDAELICGHYRNHVIKAEAHSVAIMRLNKIT